MCPPTAAAAAAKHIYTHRIGACCAPSLVCFLCVYVCVCVCECVHMNCLCVAVSRGAKHFTHIRSHESCTYIYTYYFHIRLSRLHAWYLHTHIRRRRSRRSAGGRDRAHRPPPHVLSPNVQCEKKMRAVMHVVYPICRMVLHVHMHKYCCSICVWGLTALLTQSFIVLCSEIGIVHALLLGKFVCGIGWAFRVHGYW